MFYYRGAAPARHPHVNHLPFVRPMPFLAVPRYRQPAARFAPEFAATFAVLPLDKNLPQWLGNGFYKGATNPR